MWGKSLPRIRGGLFPSRSETLVRSTRSLEVRGSLLGMCSHQGPDNVIAAAPWQTACVLPYVLGFWAFRKRHPKRSTRGLAQASALLFHLQPTKTLSEFARAQIGRLPGVERPISKYSKCLTLIFTAWPKERQCGVYVTPRPPGSFCERKSGPTTARRSLLGEI